MVYKMAAFFKASMFPQQRKVPIIIVKSFTTSRVPMGSWFPGKLLKFHYGCLGPGKVFDFSNFSKKSWESPYICQKYVDKLITDVIYFIFASNLYEIWYFSNFPKYEMSNSVR